jgi:hypothetical protein
VANRVQWEGMPRRVIVCSKAFIQWARLNGSPRTPRSVCPPNRIANRYPPIGVHWLVVPVCSLRE